MSLLKFWLEMTSFNLLNFISYSIDKNYVVLESAHYPLTPYNLIESEMNKNGTRTKSELNLNRTRMELELNRN